VVTYLDFLNEAFNSTQIDKVSQLVQKYLHKKTKFTYSQILGPEEFKNSEGKGFGIRFFFNGTQCIRFNWLTNNMSANCSSIDIWPKNPTSRDPKWRIITKTDRGVDLPLVQILPVVADIILDPSTRAYEVLTTSDTLESEELTEAMRESTYLKFIDQFVTKMNSGNVVNARNAAISDTSNDQIELARELFAALVKDNKAVSTPKGTSLLPGVQITANELYGLTDHLKSFAKVTVTKGPTGDVVRPSPEIAEFEKKVDKIAFDKQLEHLSQLTSMVIAKLSYALFVAGRGGVGKTHTVEKTLHDHGLSDGDGYHLLATTATPSIIYQTLYKNREGIILFDDCDDALGDQEGRNLIKGATDTKKVRKVGWGKRVSWTYDPVTEPEKEEMEGMYPSSFEFKGRVIFISNLKLDKLDPDGALRTRGFIINVDPTDLEVIELMETVLDEIALENPDYTITHDERLEALDTLRAQGGKSLNFRKLQRALNMRASGNPNWKELAELYA